MDSKKYWEDRYAKGGTSGRGSYGELARFKSRTIGEFIKDNGVRVVGDFGCGDGNQINSFPDVLYFGFDVSKTALELCEKKFQDDIKKVFFLYPKELSMFTPRTFELTLSLDVIYHLLEDRVFDRYMNDLFAYSSDWVIIYSSNTDTQGKPQSSHVKHRKFTDWIEKNAKDWELVRKIDNDFPYDQKKQSGSLADFYIFKFRGK